MSNSEKLVSQTEASRSRLINHFSDRTIENQSSGWSELWDRNESDLWDRGIPSPPLLEFLVHHDKLFQPIANRSSRKCAFVPGCGRGYDVILLALHGFNAYGLDISNKAVLAAEELARKELAEQAPEYFATEQSGTIKESRDCQSIGEVKFLQGDFFKREWEANVFQQSAQAGFDLVYDYTFLCALPPALRKSWADRMAALVAPGGLLVCLEFPLFKDPEASGPPWGLTEGIYWDMLALGGDGKPTGAHVGSSSNGGELSGAFTRIMRIQPQRSFHAGRGTDMLSVWRRK